ncbi:MAG: Alanine--tRNA ligase [Phycisphaerae bacterium]|nr:Alanine--tRNA ligase [Phycisphaerae bacterium]
MTSAEIRQQFIDFFSERGHRFVPSAPTIPAEDPTLMFTNAGMNQFKDIFLGAATRDYTRAVNSQKCIRVSGKHNDLEEVGRDGTHHTFFEMLGNWSFGDYFKREAIDWAWTLLTGVFGIEKGRLFVTVFGGDAAGGLEPDVEAEKLWPEMTGIDPARVVRLGKKDNFWEMGDTGPCGPCSEIHMDLRPGEPDALAAFKSDATGKTASGRFVEIWNLVFIQYERRSATDLVLLPAKHVDTGMGLERITAALQGRRSNYDTDLFAPIIAATEKLCGLKYAGKFGKGADVDNAFRVVADHIRMLSFSIADGSTPSNKDRGYVQRRILRRAVRFGWQYLNLREPFLHRLVATVRDIVGGAFGEIVSQERRVAEIIRQEEEGFLRTLDRGIKLFDDAAEQARQAGGVVTGQAAFDLDTTFGFPIDLTQLMAEERDLSVDMVEYARLVEEHVRISRGDQGRIAVLHDAPGTDDKPKYAGDSTEAKVLGFARGEKFVGQGKATAADGEVGVVLDRTCFYAEQGGQVGDRGTIRTLSGLLNVSDTVRIGVTVVHVGQVAEGEIRVGEQARLAVDPRRTDIRRHHTATHLMHWALRHVLGDDVQQAGSLVAPDRLRFDFNHSRPVGRDEQAEIERLVNARVIADEPVATDEMPIDDARKLPGVRAFFGEKYGQTVRVVSVGDGFSREFCGGTHVARTGQIGLFKIVGEEAVAKGVRRLTAVVGMSAVEQVQRMARTLDELAGRFSASVEQLPQRVEALQEEIKELKKRKSADAAGAVDAALAQVLASAQPIDGGALLCVGELPSASVEQMRGGVDWLRDKSKSAAILLATTDGEKVTLVAGVSDDLVKRGGHAGNWVKALAGGVGGSGGGRPQMAQAGGKDPDGLPAVLAQAGDVFRGMLKS